MVTRVCLKSVFIEQKFLQAVKPWFGLRVTEKSIE